MHDGQRTFDALNLPTMDESELTSERQTFSGRMFSRSILPTDAQYVKSNVVNGRQIIVTRAPAGPPNS